MCTYKQHREALVLYKITFRAYLRVCTDQYKQTDTETFRSRLTRVMYAYRLYVRRYTFLPMQIQ